MEIDIPGTFSTHPKPATSARLAQHPRRRTERKPDSHPIRMTRGMNATEAAARVRVFPSRTFCACAPSPVAPHFIRIDPYALARPHISADRCSSLPTRCYKVPQTQHGMSNLPDQVLARICPAPTGFRSFAPPI